MSSHHVVREQQEPALIIADLSASGIEIIEPLLEWSPTIIVLEECLEKVLSWGIKVDGVVVSKEHLDTVKALLEEQEPIHYLINSSEAVAVAIQFLIDRKYEAVNIIGESSGLFSGLTPFTKALQIVIHNASQRCYYTAGHFHKWVVKGTMFGTFPALPQTETNGLINSNDQWVAEKEGRIALSAKAPFWAIEYI